MGRFLTKKARKNMTAEELKKETIKQLEELIKIEKARMRIHESGSLTHYTTALINKEKLITIIKQLKRLKWEYQWTQDKTNKEQE